MSEQKISKSKIRKADWFYEHYNEGVVIICCDDLFGVS